MPTNDEHPLGAKAMRDGMQWAAECVSALDMHYAGKLDAAGLEQAIYACADSDAVEATLFAFSAKVHALMELVEKVAGSTVREQLGLMAESAKKYRPEGE